MRRIIPVFMLMPALLFIACNNQVEDGQQTIKEDSKNTENKPVDADKQDIKEKKRGQQDGNAYQLKDLKRGMEIAGLKVKRVDYEEHDFFMVELEGSLTVNGELSYNEFEDGYDFAPDKGVAPKFDIIMHERIYSFINIFAISNRKELLDALSSEQKKLLKELKTVPLTLKLSDLSVGVKIDKGRLGVAWCKFEKVEKLVMCKPSQQIIIKDYIFNFASKQQDIRALAG